jgi:hypothetical protein
MMAAFVLRALLTKGVAIACGGSTAAFWGACILHAFEAGRMPAPELGRPIAICCYTASSMPAGILLVSAALKWDNTQLDVDMRGVHGVTLGASTS